MKYKVYRIDGVMFECGIISFREGGVWLIKVKDNESTYFIPMSSILTIEEEK